MSAYQRKEGGRNPHVVVAYTDDDGDGSGLEPSSALLPPSQSPMATSASKHQKRRRGCLRLAVLFAAVLGMCIGVFELLFHGKEAESLRAAQDQIAQLKHDLGQQIQGGYSKILAATHLISTPSRGGQVHEEAQDAAVEKVKNKSVIVLKTGASVMYDRLPVQLLLAQQTISPHIHLSGEAGYDGPRFLVYSDAETQIGSFHVHNALANVSDYVAQQKDFAKQYGELNALLAGDGYRKVGDFQDGWTLDKWKFLYMWEDAYRRHPDAEWYIGYEADTYVVWRSLLKYLGTQDSSKEQMYGFASILTRNMELFANGGSPYVFSGALMRATFGKTEHFASKFDRDVEASCCGDAELTIAIRKSATQPIKDLVNTGARFQLERPREITFDEGNWCEPIFGFHHLKQDEVQWMRDVESRIRAAKPDDAAVLYSDVFNLILPPKLLDAVEGAAAGKKRKKGVELNPTMRNWEAFGSEDRGVTKGSRTKLVEHCKKECIESKGCTTWFWLKVTEGDPDGDCYLLHDRVRIGKPYEGTGARTSGWIGERVLGFKKNHACKDPPSV